MDHNMTDDKRVEEKKLIFLIIFISSILKKKNTRARCEFFDTGFIVPEIFTLYV